ncbi:molybdopterin-guanine dinucleotide biosynthesis protein B [Desulfopila sp. IMCC35008]|uniref:molybdopterin-guanine dinucleotide biosynthesis protein B n=1 Tax=Desulfopila sp. IMCC35008 TaxID=2653858 RepID=UPI0013D37607|nr:molybdopterin-guanine dinucleotide biosynthesis protein B [Desulfopila sp. IMCC35008]
MIYDNHLLIVSGTGRNVGKTELVCRLIARFSARTDIFGLKVSAIFPDEHLFHGNHTSIGTGRTLFRETSRDTQKDTSRMLRSGATEVYYMQGDRTSIQADFLTLRKTLPEKSVIISESNSLSEVVRPALHLVVTSHSGEVKARALPLLDSADLVITSDGVSGFPGIETIDLDPSGDWHIIAT